MFDFQMRYQQAYDMRGVLTPTREHASPMLRVVPDFKWRRQDFENDG
jgi:hypothetical protein